jgi:transcription initiation factor IIE alpha subunit
VNPVIDMRKTKRSTRAKPSKRRVAARTNQKRIAHRVHTNRRAKAKIRIKVGKQKIIRRKAKTDAVSGKRINLIQQLNATSVTNNTAIDDALKEPEFLDYISRSVGKRAKDILKALVTPQTDEAVAETLEIKINEARRMLNTLNTFGVTRYNVNKDNRGWLTFKWYIDTNKLGELRECIALKKEETGYKIPEGNDFFICEACYSDQKTIFPFETAFEMNFKCDCGKPMRRVDRANVERMVEQEAKIL